MATSKERNKEHTYTAMKTPPIVSQQDWETARHQLLVKEKALTRSRDALAGARRPARHGSGSKLSPSRGAGAAQFPNPAATRSAASSSRYTCAPCFSLYLLPYHFSLIGALYL